MPIDKLTDQSAAQRFGGGFPRIATLRKGAPKPDESRPGADLDYFRVVFHPPFNTPEVSGAWERLYGAQPKELKPVFVYGEKPEDVFDSWNEERVHKTNMLIRRCTGSVQVYWLDKSTGRYSSAEKPCEQRVGGQCECRHIGRLNLIFPALLNEFPDMIGYITLITTSTHDLADIAAILHTVFEAKGTGKGIPFVLGREQEKISAPMNGKRGMITKSLVYLHPLDSAQMTTALIAAPSSVPALPSVISPVEHHEQRWTADRLAKLDEWARSGLDMTADELLTRLGAETWDVFPDSAAVKTAVRAKGLTVVVREIGVTPDKEIDLLTSLGGVRLEYGRVQLEDLLKAHAERFAAVHKPDTWQAGKKYGIEPLRLFWVDKAGRIDPRRLEPLDSEVAEFEEVERDDE